MATKLTISLSTPFPTKYSTCADPPVPEAEAQTQAWKLGAGIVGTVDGSAGQASVDLSVGHVQTTFGMHPLAGGHTSPVQIFTAGAAPVSCSGRIRKAQPKRAATRELDTDDWPGIVFRIHLTNGPLILRYPNEYRRRKSPLTATRVDASAPAHPTPIGHAGNATPVAAGTGRKRGSQTAGSHGSGSGPTQSANPNAASCECLAITGIHGAHISNCYLVRNGISPSHQTASSTALCSACRCLPFIEIFAEGKFQLCISCATKFERVKRKCTHCHYIPKVEERNRRQCSQCRNGVLQCH